MEVDIEILKEQLSDARGRYEIAFKHCALIKNWCITLWVAILVVLFTKKLQFGYFTITIMLSLPVLLFWCLETIYAAGLILVVEFERDIEKRIITKNLLVRDVSEIMISSRFQKIPFSTKVVTNLKAAFTLENIVIFYLALLTLSLLIPKYYLIYAFKNITSG